MIPEYVQYLLVTYVLFPFLAFWAFAGFISLLFKHRVTLFIITILFTFSGIGLWLSSWFFFQETFLLFFLLYSFVAFLKKPRPHRLILLIIAALVQIISFNYWTLYNSWFMAFFIIAYAFAYPHQIKLSVMRSWYFLRKNKLPALLLTVFMLIVVSIWAIMLLNIMDEQNFYKRTDPPIDVETAYNRTFDFPNVLSEIFSPFLVQEQTGRIPIHSARYIGLLVLPLGVLFFFYRWYRAERFWFLLTVLLFMVVITPPILLRAWETIPFMSMIRHQFYFYQHYLQIALVILAGFALDRLQTSQSSIQEKVYEKYILLGGALVGLGVVLYVNLLPAPQDFYRDYQITLFGWLLLLYSGMMYLFVTRPSARRVLLIALVLLTYQDITRYFFEGSRLDAIFTAESQHQRRPYIITDQEKIMLGKPWDQPNKDLGFNGGIVDVNLPLPNNIWPVNNYIVPTRITELTYVKQLAFLKEPALEGDSLQFFDASNVEMFSFEALVTNTDVQAYLTERAETTLLLENDPDSIIAINSGLIPAGSLEGSNFTFQWLEWAYNQHTIQVNIPQDGWVLFRQLYSPNWEIRVDNVPVEVAKAYTVDMATYLPQGSHMITLDFSPLAKRLYWLAVTGFEIVLLLLVGLFYITRKSRFSRIKAH